MKAFLVDFDNLHIVVDTETPEELQSYTSLQECVAVCVPRLEVVDPVSIGARTEAPIFRNGNSVWTFSNYLDNPPMEFLRDNGFLLLEKV
jgi:hypothetical protein